MLARKPEQNVAMLQAKLIRRLAKWLLLALDQGYEKDGANWIFWLVGESSTSVKTSKDEGQQKYCCHIKPWDSERRI